MTDTYSTPGEFLDAVHDDMLVVRSGGEYWLAWENDDGEWLATRPRNEDDAEGPEGDRWRPLGPTLLETLAFPITTAYAHAAFKAAIEGEQ